MRTTLPEPWSSFLRELDPLAGEPTKIPCIGGFAVTQHYGSARTTVDLDVIDVAPIASRNRLLEAGRKGSSLAREHGVYLDFVGIPQVPYEYEERLVPIYEGVFENIHLFVMDPYDIALWKLKRDNDRDFHDVFFLARTTPFFQLTCSSSVIEKSSDLICLAVSTKLISLLIGGSRRSEKTVNATHDTRRFIESHAVRVHPADHESDGRRPFGEVKYP